VLGISFGFNTQSAFKDFIQQQKEIKPTGWALIMAPGSYQTDFPPTAQQYRSLGATNAGVQQQIELSKAV
jgi:hypothetical protein